MTKESLWPCDFTADVVVSRSVTEADRRGRLCFSDVSRFRDKKAPRRDDSSALGSLSWLTRAFLSILLQT